MELDLRLQEVAKLVPVSESLGDIGTDHGYLLIELVQAGKIERGIGCDLREGPLKFAKKHVRERGLQEKIELRLGDGLAPLAIKEVEGISICGMGGGTIQEILMAQKEIVEHLSYLVCQPQNNGGPLRKFLASSGWKIVEERLVESQGKIYEMFLARKGEMIFPEREMDWELGPLLVQRKEPLLERRVEELIFLTEKVLKDLEAGKKNPENKKKKDSWEKRKTELEGFFNGCKIKRCY